MESVLKFISTVESRLSQLDISNGQLIFVEDSRKIYLDLNNERISYGDFIYLSTESQREHLQHPLSALYFVYETNVIWRYNALTSKWIQVTSKPNQQIVFLDSQDFPVIGNPSFLYISGVEMYRWKDGEYQLLGSSYWKSLD